MANTIQVGAVQAPMTKKEFDIFIAGWAVKNPVKYEVKVKSGELDRIREGLKGKD